MSVAAELNFRKVLKILTPVFRSNGYRKVSQNFVLESPECWAIINFQKSRWSSSGEKTFYVNVAVTAKRLLSFKGKITDKAPAYFECEWLKRIEQLGPDTEVNQWTITDEASVLRTAHYLESHLNRYALPALSQMMTEASLLERWGVVRNYPELKAKSVLLAAGGRIDDLKQTLGDIIEKFGGGVVAHGVREHLDRLRTRFPEVMREVE